MTGSRLGQVLSLLMVSVFMLGGCGGGGSSASAESPAVSLAPLSGLNVQPLTVDAGPAGLTSTVINMPYTSVRICVPGTSTCQTIDHVLVDTGSTGLRLLNSAVHLSLPARRVGGLALYNCVQFLDQSYMWGPVQSADLYMGGSALDGELATNLPLQLVGASGAPSVPAVCAPGGFSAKDTVNALGANGVLGVGYFLQDCGSSCVNRVNNGYYHVLGSNGRVQGTALALSEQLQHPVSQFSADNNGVLIHLPALPDAGAPSASGHLVFGIGTQSNNQPGTVSVMTFTGTYFSTDFNGRTLGHGFVDSGSNGWFFGTGTYALCSGATHWYCPSSALALQAVNTGANGVRSPVNFSIADVTSRLRGSPVQAIATLAGPIGDEVSFDFGLPFFYGRRVFSAIQDRTTPLGSGPYVAY